MAATLAIHLDLVGGIAGDMFVAALVDALPALAAPLMIELAAVQPVGEPGPEFGTVLSGGLRAQRFGLVAPSHDHDHDHDHDHGHAHHGGTAYVELRARLVAAPLTEPTRRHALALLAILAEAEAGVHGISVDAVHFHELADWDSMLDVVAAGCIAALLEGATWSSSALPLGGGKVRTAHGLLPVPTPATSALLTGYPWHDDGVGGERVTPTGAAILRYLVPAKRVAAPREPGRLLAVGSGAGTRSLPGMPNILRTLVMARVAPGEVDNDNVVVLEFDVDDMSGEELALAADRLRLHPGVLDVSLGMRLGKKGRPLNDFRVLARPRQAEAIASACFTETSTIGLRWREERRLVLPRAEVAATGAGQGFGVKVVTRPGGERSAKSAHDEVAATPGLAARRRRRAEVEARALKGSGE
ncbi:MAG: LarC family nickel insertion protein [Burkholderiaceae bacterium]|nr:LarC family nickel insertion protein [Burkholderiaceae bacterium]